MPFFLPHTRRQVADSNRAHAPIGQAVPICAKATNARVVLIGAPRRVATALSSWVVSRIAFACSAYLHVCIHEQNGNNLGKQGKESLTSETSLGEG